MLTHFWAGLRAAFCTFFVFARPGFCDVLPPQPVAYVLSVYSETRSYGLWVTAPAKGCRTVRYTVASQQTFLGRSPPLRAGDSAMIHLGQGFALGDHVLAVTAIGCDEPPAVARRVLLGKAGHDHSWLWP
jgi:hypothetical protein